jgi:lipoprotein-anchoring transpeptidase ErfK/SrfK
MFGLILIFLAASALPGAEDLDALFRRAADEPVAVVPLIRAASRAVTTLPTDQAIVLADRLAPFCRRAFFGADRLPGMEAIGLGLHRVAKKESAAAVAKRYRMNVDLLARLNPGARLSRLRAGQTLKVVDLRSAPVELVVHAGVFRLLIWRGDVLAGVFPVGLGDADHPTPVGDTTVLVRVRHPDWRDPETRRVYRDGDPRNVLGGYWIGFAHGPHGHFRGIGIHGYTGDRSENWLGRPGSRGCVRMLQDDVATVFAWARAGMRVSVRR